MVDYNSNNNAADAPSPMVTRREFIMYSPAAAIAWQNEAETREVSLIEHDSIIAGLLALRDFLARPQSTGAPSSRGTILARPYATVPYWNPTLNNGAGAFELVPAVGIYPPPEPQRGGVDANGLAWWYAVDALIWRIADLTQEKPAEGAAVVPPDARIVAVFGEDTEATVTTPGLKFREHAETVRLVRSIVAGAMAHAEGEGRNATGDTRAMTAAELAARDAAIPLRDQLANERKQVSARGNMRAFGVLAVTAAGAYAISRM